MNVHVMVVEDDEAAREMMDIALSQAGFQVSAVSNGEAALDLMNRQRFALVLLDVHMPRLSGLDVLQAIGRLKRRPPVLMVSADTQGDVVRKAVGLGCIGYVAKPFLPKELIERTRWALAGPVPMTMH
jgi:DNA-binding response OmpR family regulator